MIRINSNIFAAFNRINLIAFNLIRINLDEVDSIHIIRIKMNTNAYQKECPECKGNFTATRLNQVYCSPTCKSWHNNQKAQLKNKKFQEKLELQQRVDKITRAKNSILWINRLILKKYVGQEMNISTLKQKDKFKLRYITDFDEFQNEQGERKNIFYIYDYAYYFIDEHTIKIIEA